MSDTINDFGDQWTRYPENDGYYASSSMFADICLPLLDPKEITGLKVADLGSGTGRIVNMLLASGAAHVTAVEPSKAVEALSANIAENKDRVRVVHAGAEDLPEGPYDLIVSFGVLHHIPNPLPAMQRAYECLAPGGRMLIWLYGKEGNELYLATVKPLRALTHRMPDFLLAGICHVLTFALSVYALLCKVLPLPLGKYMKEVISPYGWKHRFLTVFDQLNPTYAKYYREDEARNLMESAGFKEVKLYHRHGYSWTVLGTKI